MSRTFRAIEADALALPSRDRAALAQRLIDSLDEGTDQPEAVSSAWGHEIQRRLDAYRRHEVQPRASHEVFATARALLDENRA